MTGLSTNRSSTQAGIPRLQVQHVSKQFPGVLALDRVSLTLHPGETLAVVGENGAGKSTLMKILAGVQAPDSGQLLLDGQPVHFQHVQQALDAGIALIHQELNLAENLDVAANIFLGREPHCCGWINRRQMHAQAQQLLELVGLPISPETRVRDLAIGQQQLVEIAKAISIQARVLIMDEPTSSLTQSETETLLRVIAQLREQGVSIAYISHRLAEIERIADRVTVLRDGRNAGELAGSDITHAGMVSFMVGRDVSRFYQRTSHPTGNVVLTVEDFSTTAWPAARVNLQLRQGEIVGLAGLVGAGRSELLRALFGVDEPFTGTCRIEQTTLPGHGSPRPAMRSGLALVPEDRKQQGLVLGMSIQQNMSLASLQTSPIAGGFINPRYEHDLYNRSKTELNLRCSGPHQPVGLLSGGNQQKVVLAKWLALKPKVLLLDEPTRGIDIGAKEEIYRLIDQLAASGVAILFASSELEELMGIADRLLVMRDGAITGQLQRDQFTEQAIMSLATRSPSAAELIS